MVILEVRVDPGLQALFALVSEASGHFCFPDPGI